MNTAELTALLSDLVSIRSVNRLGRTDQPPSSQGVVDFLETRLRQKGLESRRQPVPGGEENLLATLPGRAGSPTLLFDAHTDTVPADDWADRAFTPRLDGGRLYARGSCDTKGSMVAMLAALERTAEIPVDQRPNTILFIASADEEFGRSGVAEFLRNPPQIAGAVVGEPTLCTPVVACKGAARWNIRVEGRSAHTSTPRKGVNAIARMAEVIRRLAAYEETVLQRKNHPLVEPATITPSLIRGGTAVNVVPAECSITVDQRTMPGEDPASAMRDTQAFLARELDFPLHHEDVRLWNGADLAPGHPFGRTCVRCCREGGAADSTPRGVNYGCHASDYAGAGIPAVVIGPGDIAAAHAIDEYVELTSVATAAEIYHRIMLRPMKL